MRNFLVGEMFKERARRESLYSDSDVFLPLPSEVQYVQRNLDLISCNVNVQLPFCTPLKYKGELKNR